MKKDHLAHEQRDAADDDAPGSDDDSSSDDDGDGADDSDVDVVGGAGNGVAPADREIQVSSLVFSTLLKVSMQVFLSFYTQHLKFPLHVNCE